ncbi:hypothetical protein [Oceanobacillus kapialis]|uniref:Translation initiation factor 2 n=1 Tax=Oceanobacillus kapialis TaxID=481353 RepID=A0ABW5PZW9_9BACI
MKEKHHINIRKIETNQEIQLATSLKVAWVAGLFSTIGDALGSYAAALAIEEAVEDGAAQLEKERQLERRLINLEKQLDTIQEMLESK